MEEYERTKRRRSRRTGTKEEGEKEK